MVISSHDPADFKSAFGSNAAGEELVLTLRRLPQVA